MAFFVSVFTYTCKIMMQFHDLTAGKEINRISLLTLQYGKNKYIIMGLSTVNSQRVVKLFCLKFFIL